MGTKKKQPLRMCAGCREMKPKDRLIRICCDQEGKAFVDHTGKSGGRGVYVCDDQACIARALKQNGFSRGLRTGVDNASLLQILSGEANGQA